MKLIVERCQILARNLSSIFTVKLVKYLSPLKLGIEDTLDIDLKGGVGIVFFLAASK